MNTNTAKRGLAVAAAVALAAGLAAAPVAEAQGRGGKPSASYSGGKPGTGWQGGSHGWRGGDRGWRGGDRGWRGDHGRHWRGDSRGHWRGHGQWRGGHGRHWHGGYWRHGRAYWHPGWTLGLGVGIGLAYPWWAWSYWPQDYVVVDRVVVDRPVGYVVGREGAFESAPPDAGTRWYCTSPAGYYPEVPECASGWLRVLPDVGPPPASVTPPVPVTPPASPSPAPRSDAGEEPQASAASGDRVVRISAPRIQPPAQLARGSAATQLAQTQ